MFSRRELLKEKLIPCHIIIKAVAGLPIFSKENDCFRFLFQVYVANIGKPGMNLHRYNINRAGSDLLEGYNLSSNLVKIEHSSLVNIISFALVENHAHFILSANQENGISNFINKTNLGFAKYYNIKNKRSGILFDKPFKIAPLLGNPQLNLIAWYVNIKSPLEVTEDIDKYQFSSFLDLFGQRQSKITVPKTQIKYLGINLEKIEEQANKINQKDLKEPIFLEEIND